MVAPTAQYSASYAATRPRSGADLIRPLFTAAALYRQRRALSRLDDAALHDLGLSRAEAEGEASRPFWDVPSNWRR